MNAAPTTDDLRFVRTTLSAAPLPVSVDEAIEELRELESLKAAAEARQAELALRLDAELRRTAAERGVPRERQGRGVAEHLAITRRVSPSRGRVLLALATTLQDLPLTMAAFKAGQISEWRALLLTREVASLDAVDRHVVDQQLASDPEKLATLGDRTLVTRARALVTELDAELDADAARRRRHRAEADRHLTLRDAREPGMSWLTAYLPTAQGVAAMTALGRVANQAIATGIATHRGHVMADTMIARITGGTAVTAGPEPTSIGLGPFTHPIALNLLITDTTLLTPDAEGGQETAWLDGVGPIPADLAREMVLDNLDANEHTTLRRLYTHPDTGQLVAMESTARLFPTALAEFIRKRDQSCRNPLCGAPIRHIDHIDDWATGGPTTAANGQGLCEQCNHAKQSLTITWPHTNPPPLRRPVGRTLRPTPSRPLVIEIHHNPAIELTLAS